MNNFVRFEKNYNKLPDDVISIGKTAIYFGKFKPGDRVAIWFDKENKAIKFTNEKEFSTKVCKTQSGYMTNATAFLKTHVLPIGKYQKVDDMTYKLMEV